MALALSRKEGQAIKIGENIVVTIGETRGSYTTVLVDAPKDIPVARIEGNSDGGGRRYIGRTARKRGGKVLHQFCPAEGGDGAVTGTQAVASSGSDSPAVDPGASGGCGAVVDRESD